MRTAYDLKLESLLNKQLQAQRDKNMGRQYGSIDLQNAVEDIRLLKQSDLGQQARDQEACQKQLDRVEALEAQERELGHQLNVKYEDKLIPLRNKIKLNPNKSGSANASDVAKAKELEKGEFEFKQRGIEPVKAERVREEEKLLAMVIRFISDYGRNPFTGEVWRKKLWQGI